MRGNGDGEFGQPQGLMVAPDGTVYVLDNWNDRIQLFNSQGRFLRKLVGYGQEEDGFRWGQDLSMDSDGNLYVSSQGNHGVLVFKPTM